jgi:predicted double-glycine peptidase
MRHFIKTVLVVLFLAAVYAHAQVALDSDGIRATKSVRTLKEMRNAQVVRQNWDMTCGAAALSTLLTYDFKDDTPETAVVVWILRRTSPVKVRALGGFSLLDLKRFVQARGYRAEGFSEMSLEELSELKIPAIVPIHSKGVDHFVIVRGVFGDRVVLADPAFGNMTMKTGQFQSVWKEGIAFIVHPPDPGMFQKSEQERSALSGVVTPRGATVYRAVQQSAPSTPLPPGP